MVGLGTLLNMGAILIGGAAGIAFRKFIGKSLQENLISVMGLSCMFLGIAGTMELMLKIAEGGGRLATSGGMMAVLAFTAGTLVGTLADLEGKFEGFGAWLQKRAGRGGDSRFISAFVTSSLTVCIGAMAVVGAIQDGIAGDWSVLAAKSVMDAVIIMAMAASMGEGCLFSAVPVGIFQGAVTLLAWLAGPFLSEQAIANIGLTGSMMIFCVGANLAFGKRFSVANMLPTLLFAAAWAYFF